MSSLSVGAHSRQPETRWAPARQGFAAWRHKARIALAQNAQRITGLRRLTLTVAGLGSLDIAAWHVNDGIGYAAVGVSLLVLEWATSSD